MNRYRYRWLMAAAAQRGTGFPRIVNSTVDIGAYEWAPISVNLPAAGAYRVVMNGTTLEIRDSGNGLVTSLPSPADPVVIRGTSGDDTLTVDFAGGNWRARYFAAKSNAALHVMPDELGPLPDGQNAYERDNQWMLERAARFGADKIAFICLWNGEGGDGPGGAKHLMEKAGRRTTRLFWLDTRKLWD